ncbi:MAG: exo-alpha-sialidase [Kiritimatiellales bacterium]|nr:exo-alpha-sialidase [Kiritimatiellales bacterium]
MNTKKWIVLITTIIVAGLTAGRGWSEPRTADAFMQGKGAVLEPLACPVQTVEAGAAIFLDRVYTFLEPPEGLTGLPFIKTPIAGGVQITVAEDGLLDVITPVSETAYSNVSELEARGFTWVQAPAVFQCFGEKPIDRCRIYQKFVRKGERFQLKKWAIFAGFNPQGQKFYCPPARVKRVIQMLKHDTTWADAAWKAQDIQLNRPDYVVFVPRQPRDKSKRDQAKAGDTYNDHFQVIQHGGKLFAFWTQASREAAIDQHIAFSKSRDQGDTWSEPIILAGSRNKKNPGLRASWQQPMISRTGRIYVLWNQQVTSRGPHCGNMFGKYSDDEGETWSAPKMVPMERMSRDPEDPLIPPSWCNWQRPLRLGKDEKYFVGVSRHGRLPGEEKDSCTVEFLQFGNIDDDPEVEDIKLSWFSTNENVLEVRHEKFGSACEEAGIVKLPDGRLFALMRTCAGHPFWSQSRDAGVTWSRPKKLLDRDGGTAYLHPRSPCPIYDWKGPEAASGMYFALVHNTFDFSGEKEYQRRGPLYLIAGRFNPNAEQPVEFAPPRLFAPRPGGNSFYTSYTMVDGKGILWFPDHKFHLLGRIIGEEWFEDWNMP